MTIYEERCHKDYEVYDNGPDNPPTIKEIDKCYEIPRQVNYDKVPCDYMQLHKFSCEDE